MEDEWRREVYERAVDKALSARTVFDIGCGSGFRLMKHFTDIRRVGFDLEPTVSFLKNRYPHRDWRISSPGETIRKSADIVICADVVEHIPDPDLLVDFLAGLRFKKLVLSTPDRGLIYDCDHSGPRLNPHHCREWTNSGPV